MIDAVVYIGHGSRRVEGNVQFIRFVESVMEEIPFKKQEVAFLELTTPTIFDTLTKLIETGAKRILIVPVLLFAAIHHKQDIPQALQAIKIRYPHVTFKMTEPFGIHENMIQLVVKRIGEEMIERDGAILIVGRGSSDPEPIEQLRQISRNVERIIGVPVYTAFLTAFAPKMNTAIPDLQNRYNKIYVMPYLLFTGLLLKKIERTIAAYSQDIILCRNLEFDELMKQTLIERIEEKYDG